MFDGLRHFLLAVELGTVTEAAVHAHLSQPAMSASLKRLEEQLGASLLERGRTGVRPTAAGAALLPHARAAIAAVTDAERAVAEIAGKRAGSVRIGAGNTACTYLLPPLLKQFRDRWPGVRLRLEELSTEGIRHALHEGKLDLGVVTEGVLGPEPWLSVEPWRPDPLVVVRAPDGDDAVWVAFCEGSPIRETLMQHFPAADVVMSLSSITSIKGHVRAGVGRALVPLSAVESDLARGLMVQLEPDAGVIVRQLQLAHRGEARLAPAAAALRSLLLSPLPNEAPEV